MSSGVTDDFETYDFYVFTRYLSIHGKFTGVMQSISITEMTWDLSWRVEDLGEPHLRYFSRLTYYLRAPMCSLVFDLSLAHISARGHNRHQQWHQHVLSEVR